MKMGPKNLEWVLVAGLILVTLIEFLLLSGGVAANTLQTTLINVILLMVFGGQLIIAIILLRMYDLMLMGNPAETPKKKK